MTAKHGHKHPTQVERDGPPLIEMKDISIAFGGIKAVDHASVDLYPGEVVGLLGHNGAGKSTLIKILSGAYKRDHGDIFIKGEKVEINNPRDAKALGSMEFACKAAGAKLIVVLGHTRCGAVKATCDFVHQGVDAV
ncbi:MAG: ATP-binding cassette domain-containing protein, partial [Aestuariivirga sp.]|nr:ATP-binding cassette domain-containing protein [Aestuariivirga sp.]